MRLSLRMKFFAPILILTVVGMAVLVMLNDRATLNALQQVEGQSMTLLSQSMAKDITGTVAANLKVLGSFATTPVVAAAARGRDPDAANALLATLKTGLTGADYANIFNMQGTSQASSNVASIGKVKVPDRDYFALVTRDNKANVVSKAIISRTMGRAAIVLAQPVRDASGALVGVINTGMDLESLTRNLATTKIGQTGYAFILDAQGMVLAHPDKALLMKTDLAGTDLGKRILATTGTAVIRYADASGRHLAAVTREPRTGWFFVVEAPMREFAAFAAAATRQNVLIALVVTVVLLAAIVILLRLSVLRGLRRCMDFAAAVSRGELDRELDIRSGDELQTMGEALTTMGKSIKANLAEAKAKGEEAASQAQRAGLALEEAKRAQAQADAAKNEGMLLAADQLQGVMVALADASSQLAGEVSAVVASVGSRSGAPPKPPPPWKR